MSRGQGAGIGLLVHSARWRFPSRCRKSERNSAGGAPAGALPAASGPYPQARESRLQPPDPRVQAGRQLIVPLLPCQPIDAGESKTVPRVLRQAAPTSSRKGPEQRVCCLVDLLRSQERQGFDASGMLPGKGNAGERGLSDRRGDRRASGSPSALPLELGRTSSHTRRWD